MKALISPKEKRVDYLGNVGQRIAQVEPFAFEVAEPLYWLDCPDDCNANTWFYFNDVIRPMELPPPVIDEEVQI